MYELRPYQASGVKECGDAFRAGFRAPALVIPTAGGKTPCAAHIIRSVTQRGWRTLFLAHRKELIDQASSKLHEWEVPHGIVMAGRMADRRHAVQVASVATMINRLDRYDPFDLIVIDECHRSGAPSYGAINDYYGNPRKLGLTGTFCRLDGKPLGVAGGGLFDYIAQGPSTRELITDRYIKPYRFYQPDTPDLSGVGTRAGEYIAADAAGVMDKPKIIGSIVEHHAKLGVGRPSIIFAASVEHAEHVAEAFRVRGLRATACSADTDDKLRANVLKDLANGQLDVAVNVGLWIEGMDCPAISYVGLGRPTKSLTYYRQAVGRGFRLHRDWNDLVIADHANCQLEHGYPCVHIEWSLDGKPPRDKDEEDVAVKRCERCYAVCMASARVCDALLPDGRVCGWVFAQAPPRPREVRQVEGTLREADLQAVIAEEARKAAERRAQEGSARSAEALAALAAERGYKAGWADHRQQARDEKAGLQRRLIELRRQQGCSLSGLYALKPKALRAEIAERQQAQAEKDEAEIA